MTKKSIKTIAILLMVTLVSNSCMRNPVTGKRELSLVSESQEQKMGDNYNPQVLAQFGVYEDEKMQKFIDEKGQQMAKISHRPHLKYQFKVVDSHVVNAFAVPGGYVYFTRGIMAHFNNEAEFAGVLGHEIGHITARHSAKQQTKQMAAQVLVIGGMIASSKFREYGNTAMQGLGLLFLKFSRDNESQSDKLGVEYSTSIGYDSHNMANFFSTIGRLSKASGQSVPDFMSTHPNPDNRFTKVHEMSDNIQKNVNKDNLKVGRDSYLRMIEGMVYGEDPRQGFVENWMFYHPELKFQFPVPTDWKYQNSPASFQMAPESGKAMMQLTAGSGTSLDQVKTDMLTKYKLKEISSKKININGLNGLEYIAEQVPAAAEQGQQQQQQEQAPVRILTTLVEYNGLIYNLMGVAAITDFSGQEGYFRNVMSNFRTLTDPDKLSRQPERIKIQTVKKAGTLQQVLGQFNQSSDRHNELAILNGMELTQPLTSGTLIKTVGK